MHLKILLLILSSLYALSGATRQNSGGPVVTCGPDTLLIQQDCNLCYCSAANRRAKCFPKQCERRTKNTGACPNAHLNMDDFNLCKPTGTHDQNVTHCGEDHHCPGNQLCCFDYCKGKYCANPVQPSRPPRSVEF